MFLEMLSSHNSSMSFAIFAPCLASGDLVVALFEEDYEWYNATVVQDPVYPVLILS